MIRTFFKNYIPLAFMVAILLVCPLLFGSLVPKGVAFAEESNSQNQEIIVDLDENGILHRYPYRCATKCQACDYVRSNKTAHKSSVDTEYQSISEYEHTFICTVCGELATERHMINATSKDANCTRCSGSVALSLRSSFMVFGYEPLFLYEDVKIGVHYGEFYAVIESRIPVLKSEDVEFDNSIIKEIVEFTEVEPNKYTFTLIGYNGEREECSITLESYTKPADIDKGMSCIRPIEEEIGEIVGIAIAAIMVIALVVGVVVIIVRNKRK
ncbi:MAG: hypothetical protein J6V69_00400 [Clostridia bacterium]|nr:hypothetical protein [Clostridia bacterium]